jgi:hypothetical protein
LSSGGAAAVAGTAAGLASRVSGSALVVCGAADDEAGEFDGKYVVVAPLALVSALTWAAAGLTLSVKQNAKTPRLRTRRAESLFIPKWLR